LARKAALTNAVSAIYNLPASDFHDITAGGNGALAARAGYDAVTGRGTPYADRVVSGLVGTSSITRTTTPTPALTPTPAPKPTKSGLNLTFIAQRVASFLQKTTGGKTTPATTTKAVTATASRPAVRLPSGSAAFLGSSARVTELWWAVQYSKRHQ